MSMSRSSQRKALRSVDRNDFAAVVRQRDEARAEVERLRSALEGLLTDIVDFGEPRRHKDAMTLAHFALGASPSSSSDPSSTRRTTP